jgi:hypothetical protein
MDKLTKTGPKGEVAVGASRSTRLRWGGGAAAALSRHPNSHSDGCSQALVNSSEQERELARA